METVWIQVFVLTLTQCIAPAGKMVCQEAAVEYQFLNKDDCEHALLQMINVASAADNVIINKASSHCRASTSESKAFASSEDANAALGLPVSEATLAGTARPADFTQSAHQERLKNLHECEDVAGVAPCKIGQIIVEASTDAPKAEIWQQQD